MATIQFEINGLTSQQNGERLARTLASLDGISGADVSTATGTVTLISHAPQTNAASDQARAAVRAAGYELASEFGRPTSRRSQRWVRPRTRAMRSVRA